MTNGGTDVSALARAVGRDGARKASEHKTNKAFDRYCQIQEDSAFEMAKITAELKGKGGEVIPLDKKKIPIKNPAQNDSEQG